MSRVSRAILRLLWSHVAGRVTYLLGAKAPALDCDSALIHQIDCSGFVRWFLARASLGTVILPDGSFAQLQWCLDNKLQRQNYEQDAGRVDNVLRIHFLTEARAAAVGRPGDRHVWLTLNGVTYESHGGNPGGCISRSWSTWILSQSDYSFVLPSVATYGGVPSPRG